MEPIDVIHMVTSSLNRADEQLHGFTLEPAPIGHRRYNDCIYAIAALHQAKRKGGNPGGILIMGLSGAGKTFLGKSYAGLFPRKSTLEGTQIPVLQVVVPASPTSSSLAEEILSELGHAKPARGSANSRKKVIRDYFKRSGVEVLILDEFHHLLFPLQVTYFRDLIDWLKDLLSTTEVAIVACGLPYARAVLNIDGQLKRRISMSYVLTPFDANSKEDFSEFRSVLKMLGRYVPIPFETPIHEANMARRILIASYGLLSWVCKIIQGAVKVAAREGLDRIDLDTLAIGFKEAVWQEVPDRLNPFHRDSQLRLLDRSGEVYDRIVHPVFLGSPVARRIDLHLSEGAT